MKIGFRKSVGLGPLRVNVSRRGARVSAGPRGAKVSAGRGGRRLSFSLFGLFARRRI